MFFAVFLACDSAGDSAADPCDGAPIITWENYGEALMTENCEGCHSSTAVERQGAPEEVTFDTHDQVLTWRVTILSVTNPDNPTMPPALDMDPEDAERLQIWLTCWE